MAQSGGFKFKSLTIDNGLSQSNVDCILQDKKGFLWFGTSGGLNRYDGTLFKKFLHDPADSTSISNNIIYSLHQDSLGLLWVGTQEGLSILDPEKQRFTVIKKFGSLNQSSPTSIVKTVIQDTIGNYWVGTFGDGLHKIVVTPGEEELVDRMEITSYYHQPNNHSLSSNKITSLVYDNNGYLWVGTEDNGLNKFDPVGAESIIYKSDEGSGVSGNHINCIFQDRSGDIWVGTNSGLNRFRKRNKKRTFKKNERISQYQHNESITSSLSNNIVNSIHQGKSGLIYIGTEGGGLSIFSKRTARFTHYQNDITDNNSIVSNTVLSIYDDKLGILWLGTNSGISKLNSQRKKFNHFQQDGLDKNTISSNYIQAIYKEMNGDTWIGTSDGGLNKLNSKTGKNSIYTTSGIYDSGIKREIPVTSGRKKIKKRKKRKEKLQYKSPQTINDMNILSLHRDTRYTLWVGTGGGGLNRINLKTGKITYYTANSNHPDSLSNNAVRTIYEDNNDIMWVGTEGGGLNRFDRRKFKHFTRNEFDKTSISNNDVRAIVQDQQGMLWVGTYGGGLNRFDPINEVFTNYSQSDSPINLNSNIVFSLHVDANNILWIGTTDGLIRFDIEKQKFKTFSINDGLANNMVYGILEDKDNHLWLSTNHGLSRFDKSKQVFNNYDRNDGLQSNEFVPGSFSQSKRGEMLFGGINGFNSFFPSSVRDNEYIPNVVITDFKIFNKTINPKTTDSPLSKDISETSTINLSYKDAVFGFEFVALNFTNADKNQYAYKLENFDSDWNFIGNRTYANYTNLSPGKYRFIVKASNNDGIWNEEGTGINIIIHPPFWDRWWFKTLMVIGFLLSGFVLYKIRVKRIENKKQELEREVADRTAEIVLQKDLIERKKQDLEIKKQEIEEQNYLLAEKNEEIVAQRNNIEEKNQQLEKAWDDIVRANNELKTVNLNLEEKVEERTIRLQDAIKRLVNSNQELDTFLYRASHDLKGPITRLLGLTQLAKIDKEGSKSIDYIQIIENSSVEMNKTLNKLINIHSINTKPVVNSSIDFESIIKSAIKSHKEIITRDKIAINIDVKQSKKLFCDEELVTIIVNNLIENAVTFRSEKKSKISIYVASDNSSIALKVNDNGLGIQDGYKNKIFEMFFRGSEVSQGNGLGLYLVKKAIDKLNGKIVVESKEGSHSSFSLSIPLQQTKERKLVNV